MVITVHSEGMWGRRGYKPALLPACPMVHWDTFKHDNYSTLSGDVGSVNEELISK